MASPLPNPQPSLDEQLNALQAVLSQMEDELKADLANMYTQLPIFEEAPSPIFSVAKPAMVDVLTQQAVPLVQQYNAAAAQVTAQWYDELAPDAPYKAEVPDLDMLLNAEQVANSISWAVNTATSVDTSLAQMQKSMQRHLYNGSRDTVVYNAKAEKVKYVRHANYAGVCNWCLVMATKGAVYTSAAAAVAGHDNCKCFAVPIRPGVKYTPPKEVQEAAKKYEKATAKLKAEGKQANLDNIIAEMDKIDTAALPKPVVSAYDKLPPAQKKTVQNSYQGKKNKAKAKFGPESPEYTSLKSMGSSGYYELVYLPEHNATQLASKATAAAAQTEQQAKWLTAEAKFNAQTAMTTAADAEAKAAAASTAKQAAYTAHINAEDAAWKAAQEAVEVPTTPPPSVPEPQAPGFAHFDMQGSAGGSHGAVIMTDIGGTKYLVKPQKHYKNLLDETTSKLAHKTGLPAPNIWTTNEIPGIAEASVQEFIKGGNAFAPKIISKGNLQASDLLALQKNQVFDWLIANHDTHAQQWVRDHDGKLVGIDKGQAMKWLGKDKLDWDFHPNKDTGEHEPIYNTIWKMGLQGDLDIIDPHGMNSLHDYIQGVQAIPDNEYKDMLRPFAEAAAQSNKLLNATDGFNLLPKYPVGPNDVEAFLDLAVARKNNLQNDFDALYAKYTAQKTGTSNMAPPPQVVPQPAEVIDHELLAMKQYTWIGDQLVDAHKAAKLGNTAKADTKIKLAQFVSNTTAKDWVGSDAWPGMGTMKLPTTPAEKALWDAQKSKAFELLDLQAQGAITPQALATPGHITGVKIKQYDDLMKMTPEEFAAGKPDAVEGFANPQPVAAVKPSDYYKLPPAQKKTVQNSYSGKKNKAKTKFGVNSPEYLELKLMGPDGYYANVYAKNQPAAQAVAPKAEPLADWEQELLGGSPAPVTGPKQINPADEQIITALASILDADYEALSKDALYKVGNQFSGKKNKAKKGTDPEAKAMQYLYSQWSKKDFWAAQQLQPGSGSMYKHPYHQYEANQLTDLQANEYKMAKALHDDWVSTHPGQPLNDSPFWGLEHQLKWLNANEYKQWLIDHGQTSMLGSPLGGGPKVPGAKVNIEKPPPNPPTDLDKLAKIQQWQAQYLAAKPGGTGFNPVKSYNPQGTLKTNIDDFAQDIGVGYLTDDQLTQVLVKLPVTKKNLYLKQYAEAKGQKAADAVALKVNPPGNPNVVSPPTSAGSKPAGMGSSYVNAWKEGVQIKPGTKHTPVRTQQVEGAKSLANPLTGKNYAVPDLNAPLGSADNPHVFVKENSTDFKTFGAMHTDQDEKNWVGTHLQPVKAYTGSAYGNYNAELRNELQSMMDDWLDPVTNKPKIDPITGKSKPKPKPSKKIQNIDAAFDDATALVNEEWMIITRGASQREFQDNTAGLKITSGGYSGTVESLQPLVGKEFTQHGIGSTSITTDPAFHKHVRVIYRIPPGSKFVYVDGTPNGGYSAAISNNAGEREVLLPRDSRYKVLEVRETTQPGFKIDVVVELVEQEAL